jgi:hypothetical protein
LTDVFSDAKSSENPSLVRYPLGDGQLALQEAQLIPVLGLDDATPCEGVRQMLDGSAQSLLAKGVLPALDLRADKRR